MHYKKWEMNETRYAQTTFISDPFSVKHKMLRPERGYVNGNFNNNPNTQIKSNQIKSTRF